MNRFLCGFGQLMRRALHVTLPLFKIMIPVLILVKVLKELGLIEFLGLLLAPVMKVVGLPGSSGLVWATTMMTNLYGGMVVYVSLYVDDPLSVAQTTVLTAMMLVAHSLPVELRIAQKAGVRLPAMATLRIGGAFVLGSCLNGMYTWGDWLQTPNVVSWLPSVQEPSLLMWAYAQVKNLVMIYFIVVALLCLMRILDLLRITELMNRCLQPVLGLLGIGRSATTITIIGMTLGLAYGGGLIIEEANSGRIDKKDVLFSLTLMGLCHSIIEDSLLMALLGGHLSGILWGRALFAIVCVVILVRTVSRLSDPAFHRYLIHSP